MLKFGKLFQGRKNSKEEDPDQNKSGAVLSNGREEVREEDQIAALVAAAKLPTPSEEMIALWKDWSGTGLPPRLSLAEGIDVKDLNMTVEDLERESKRIEPQIAQAAKQRMAQINAKKEEAAATNLDAECVCYTSQNKMAAWLFALPPVGEGRPLGNAFVMRALAQSGVVKGVLNDAFEKAAKEAPYFQLIPIAVGIPPVAGIDGAVVEKFPRKVVNEIQLDENGAADYRSISYVQIIEEGAVICDITPCVKGTDGLRVDGQKLPVKPVHPAKIPKGKNTEVTEDGLHLIASVSGHLEYVRDNFHVRAVLDIAGDVDYSTGNVDFPGDVHIHGDVRENFVVKAKGNVLIDGLMEAATVDAGGDILISHGVVGDNRALLQSDGNIRAKYLESCTAYAGKSVYADCIVTSSVFCDDSISVTSGRGSIIGGVMTVGGAIRAQMLGARSGRQTELILGSLPYVQNKLKRVDEEIANTHKEKEKLEREIFSLQGRTADPEAKGKLVRAKMQRSTLDSKCANLEMEKEHLQNMVPDLSKCRVECETAYPFTKIQIGECTSTIDTVRYDYKAMYDKEKGTLKEFG